MALDNIVDSSESLGLKLVRIVGGGEPLINPNTPYFIRRLSDKGVCTNLITNGELLDRNNSRMGNVPLIIAKYASQLRVSLDAACQKTFNEEHHPPTKESFQKILRSIENIANLRESLKTDLIISTTFLVNKNNYTELVDFVDLCGKIGVNMVWFKSLANYDNFSDHEIHDLNSMIDAVRWNYKGVVVNASRFDTKTMKKQAGNQKKKPTEYCFVPQLKAYITANGGVANCISYQDNSNFVYGNIYQSSLEQIWRSDNRLKLIEQRKYKPHTNCVKCCMEKSFNNGTTLLFKNPQEHEAIKHRLGFEELREVIFGRVK
jgi:radical SAM protein with 4Fe4S-binding SPASM domain